MYWVCSTCSYIYMIFPLRNMLTLGQKIYTCVYRVIWIFSDDNHEWNLNAACCLELYFHWVDAMCQLMGQWFAFELWKKIQSASTITCILYFIKALAALAFYSINTSICLIWSINGAFLKRYLRYYNCFNVKFGGENEKRNNFLPIELFSPH